MEKNRIGDQLKYWRNISGLSRVELAEKTGIAHQNIYAYETGRRRPSYDTLQLLCDSLGVDFDVIIGKFEKK